MPCLPILEAPRRAARLMPCLARPQRAQLQHVVRRVASPPRPRFGPRSAAAARLCEPAIAHDVRRDRAVVEQGCDRGQAGRHALAGQVHLRGRACLRYTVCQRSALSTTEQQAAGLDGGAANLLKDSPMKPDRVGAIQWPITGLLGQDASLPLYNQERAMAPLLGTPRRPAHLQRVGVVQLCGRQEGRLSDVLRPYVRRVGRRQRVRDGPHVLVLLQHVLRPGRALAESADGRALARQACATTQERDYRCTVRSALVQWA